MPKRIETYRGVVYPWVIDHVGHMNVREYTAKFDEASWQFFAQLGVSPSMLKDSSCSFVALEQRTKYKKEVFSGAALHVTTEIVEIGRSTLRFVHRMFNSETHDEVATSEIVALHFDTQRRSSAPLPPCLPKNARTLLGYVGLGGATAPEASAKPQSCRFGVPSFDVNVESGDTGQHAVHVDGEGEQGHRVWRPSEPGPR